MTCIFFRYNSIVHLVLKIIRNKYNKTLIEISKFQEMQIDFEQTDTRNLAKPYELSKFHLRRIAQKLAFYLFYLFHPPSVIKSGIKMDNKSRNFCGRLIFQDYFSMRGGGRGMKHGEQAPILHPLFPFIHPGGCNYLSRSVLIGKERKMSRGKSW